MTKRLLALALAATLLFSLCACGGGSEDAERECGVYVTVEASDIYTVSCGTESGSDSYSNVDGENPIEAGTVAHFDFAGDAAEGAESAVIDYSICIYDKDFNVLELKSFSDDFSNLARIDITVTAEHKIINSNAGSCGGDVVVEMQTASPEDGVSYAVPTIIMPNRSDAAAVINESLTAMAQVYASDTVESNRMQYAANVGDGTAEGLSAFSMSRAVTATRADSGVVSLRFADSASLGTTTTNTISGRSYNSQTGAELLLADLGDSGNKLINTVSEYILISFTQDEKYASMTFNEGYSDALRALVSDGHWYLNGEGLVIIANAGEIAAAENGSFEFTVPYSELEDVIDEAFIPAGDLEGGETDISVLFAADAQLNALTVLGSEPSADIASLIVTASGSVYDLGVYAISYNSETGAYAMSRQLIACSDMSDGAALAINETLTGTTPTLAVTFSLADGTSCVRLLSLDENGAVVCADPNGGLGTVITSRMPYTCDLDGDGTDETISLSGPVVNLEVGSETAELETPVASIGDVRLYDLDGDGVREIYLDGTDESGAVVICCALYSPDGSAKLSLASFNGQGYASGSFKSFESGALICGTRMDVLGTYQVKSSYTLSEGAFTRVSGDYVFDNNTSYVTTSASITLTDGSILQSGTSLRFTSTDGSSVISFVTDGGFTGSIPIQKSNSGWTIGGKTDTSCFVSLPYQS